MTKAIIEAEIKNILKELIEARKCKISSYLDELMLKLELLGQLSEVYK